MMRRGKRYKSIQEENIGTWMLLINTLFFALSFSLGNAARAAAIFGPYIVFYIPNLLERAKHKKTAKTLIIILCIVAYILNVCEEYEDFCTRNEIVNGVVRQNTRYIRELYQELSRDHRI